MIVELAMIVEVSDDCGSYYRGGGGGGSGDIQIIKLPVWLSG